MSFEPSRYQSTRTQPTRTAVYLKRDHRRTGANPYPIFRRQHTDDALLSVAASDWFRGKAAVTITGTRELHIDMWRPSRPRRTARLAPRLFYVFLMSSLPRPATRSRKTEVLVAPWALRELETDLPFVVLRVRVPGHMSVILYDREARCAEWFDASAATVKFKEFGATIAQIFPKKTLLQFVCQTSLQHDSRARPVDFNCVDWCYYFLYRRIVMGQSASEIVATLQSLSVDQRLDLIARFRCDFLRDSPVF